MQVLNREVCDPMALKRSTSVPEFERDSGKQCGSGTRGGGRQVSKPLE